MEYNAGNNWSSIKLLGYENLLQDFLKTLGKMKLEGFWCDLRG